MKYFRPLVGKNQNEMRKTVVLSLQCTLRYRAVIDEMVQPTNYRANLL